MIIKAFPDQKTINPKNIDDLGYIKKFDSPESGITLDFESLVLVNEDYKRVYEWIYSLQGRFENIPARVDFENGIVLDHYLDLNGMKFTDDEVDVGIQLRKGTDHFFDNAKTLTFELLRSEGFIPDSIIINAPYILIPRNLKMEAAMTTITLLSLLKMLYDTQHELLKIPAAVTTPIVAAAKLIILVVNLVITIVLIIDTAQKLKELYFPKVRNIKAVSDYELIKAGCAKLGYTLDSDLLFSLRNICTIGKPEILPNTDSIFKFAFGKKTNINKGYPTAQDSTPTLWSLIQHYLEKCNARIFVHEGVVKIEDEQTFIDTANVTIKPTMNNEEKRVREWVYNDEDVWGRKYMTWATDYNDIHSPDSDVNARVEYISQPLNVTNPDLVRLIGLKEYQAPFALAGRKNGLTENEIILSVVFKQIDILTAALGGGTNFAGAIQARDGVMVIEDEYFGITKKVWLVDGKQPSNYKDLLSMDRFYTLYHLPLEVQNNSFRIEKMRVPFTSLKFTELLTNNFVILDTGEIVEVVEVNYKDRKYYAEITIKRPDDSAFNVKTIKLA